ncbi:hypothetical protein [Mesorhizobium sp. A556]
MNTTIWLREARERFGGGGGVPVSGRRASFAVLGTMGPAEAGRSPNSPLFAGVMFMASYNLIERRIPSGTVEANMAKMAARCATGSGSRQADQPL